MSKRALVVELQVKPEHREACLAVICEHAAGTRADADGCRQFDVLVPTYANMIASRTITLCTVA